MHKNEIIEESIPNDIKEIKTTRNKEMKTLIFGDDQVIMTIIFLILLKKSTQINKQNIKIWIKISTNKTKTISF
jgi:hypothetical protein